MNQDKLIRVIFLFTSRSKATFRFDENMRCMRLDRINYDKSTHALNRDKLVNVLDKIMQSNFFLFAFRTKSYCWLLSLIIFFGCEHPGIYKRDGSGMTRFISAGDSEDVLIHMKMRDDSIRLVHDLFILNDHSLMIFNDYPDKGSLARNLSPAEFNAILQVIHENNFFNLQNNLGVADDTKSIFYEITYQQGDLVHSISAYSSTISDRGRRIIEALNLLDTNLRNSLEIKLTTDKLELNAGESLQIGIGFKNHLENEIVVTYPEGQVFDLVFYRSSEAQSTDLGSGDEILRLNLDFRKEPVEKQLKVAPYRFALLSNFRWNMSMNERDMLNGTVTIVGELLTTPGGTSQTMQIKIN